MIMSDLTALRLYFAQGARAQLTRFWHHLSAPALSHRLLTAAKRNGIQQALLYQVHAGFLPGQQLSHHHFESAPARHPLCIELVDTEARLRDFLRHHAEELQHVRTVLFRCELVC